ncbi:MAG TPA: hypothetical protein VHT70_02555 [Candidatus Saccharimonadales bacterium]|nr:hypothetical protein [Candidatus Saccharimonadales bacterium]
MQKYTILAKRIRTSLNAVVIGVFLALTGMALVSTIAPSSVSAADTVKFSSGKGQYWCGSGKNAVNISINIGCKGQSCQSRNTDGCSAIIDAAFAIIRFLSAGVGLVVVASIVWAGIQYTTSRGDPGATAQAIERIRNTLIALLIYVFSYAILNYLIPKGFFVQ